MIDQVSLSIKLLLLIACAATVSIVGAQNVILNGDFETPPFETDGVVSDWAVTGFVGDVSGQGFTSASHAAAFSLGGDSQGNMLSQSFATNPGQSFTLDFDAGVAGVRSGGPLQLQIQVFGTGTLLDQTVTPPYNGNFNPASFDHFTFMFIADSSSAILKFTDVGLGNSNADTMLDTVSVAPTLGGQVPEPTSGALMILGVAPLVYALRRRLA
jgi:Protein of unknown function (DUF642)